MKDNFNFLKNSLIEPSQPDAPWWVKVMKIMIYPLAFAGIFILIFSFQILLSAEHPSANPIASIAENFKSFSFLNTLGITKEKPLNGEDRGRVNILLTGIGGLGHDGPFLTDTIIIASLDLKTNQVALVSLPRDMSVPITNIGWRKINSINSIGEVSNPGHGAEYAAGEISTIFNQPIDYYARIDFSGFEKLIDELGGVDVYVEKSFVDNEFPADYGDGFAPASFQQGWIHMDGHMSLVYARSRHGNNGEGSDFSRSQRQEKIIKAVKEKVLSLNTLFSLHRLGALYDAYKKNMETNLQPWEIIRLANIARGVDSTKIINKTFDDLPGSPLYSTILNGAYLLLPHDQTYGEIRQIIENIFNPDAVQAIVKKPTIIIQNGTSVEGLAYRFTQQLKKDGYNVLRFGNGVQRNTEKTIIYDLTNNAKSDELTALTKKVQGESTVELPDWLASQKDSFTQTGVEFIILLGQNAALSKIDE